MPDTQDIMCSLKNKLNMHSVPQENMSIMYENDTSVPLPLPPPTHTGYDHKYAL